MKGAFWLLTIVCLLAAMPVGDNGFAQTSPRSGQAEGESRIGTNAAPELLIPVGGRYLAMGGAAIATAEGIEAIYWNPAGLARAKHTANAMFSHMGYIADIGINYAAASATFGGLGTIGVSLKAVDIGDIVVTTEEATEGTGAVISPQFVTIGLTFSRTLTDRISVGVTANIISETIQRVGATGLAFDIGIQYRDLASISGLSLGVAVKHIGPSMSYSGSGLLTQARSSGADRLDGPLGIETQKDEMPSLLEFGLSYTMNFGEKSNLEIVGLFQDNNFEDDAGTFGAEYNYNDTFFLRGGYRVSPDAADDVTGQSAHIFGATLGAGLYYEFNDLGIGIDYTYRDVDIFDASNVVSIQLGF